MWCPTANSATGSNLQDNSYVNFYCFSLEVSISFAKVCMSKESFNIVNLEMEQRILDFELN